MRFASLILVLAACATSAFAKPNIPVAVIADPAPDARFPARMEVIHVPSGGVLINGVAYVPSGPGPHPAFMFFHGLPGNERNLDLVQAVRRAGWTAVAVNYRGSWGSSGNFRFAQNLEDAQAVLAFVRAPENARKLSIDVGRIVIAGHSMGAWVTAETLAHDSALLGGVLISAGDMGAIGLLGQTQRAEVVALMDDNRESLTGVTAESMTDELVQHGKEWSFSVVAPQLVNRRLLVLYSSDFVKSDSVALIEGIKAAGGKSVESDFVATDHSWSDHRIALESLVIRWLRRLVP